MTLHSRFSPQSFLAKVAVAATLLTIGSALLAADPPKRIAIKNGTVVGATSEGIVVSDGTKTYNVKAKVGQQVMHVTGKLRLDQLKPGMIVRFTSNIKGTKIEEPITDIKIFTPNDGFPPGILQDDSGSGATITGQLTKIKEGDISVSAGRKKFTAKIAENASIMVESIDYTIASPGDPVEVDGYISPTTGAISAKKVVITVGGNAEPKEEKKPKAKKTE